ncbi:MAG: hypothetical protein AAFN11_09105, partial [Chloroflexota bacterium]
LRICHCVCHEDDSAGCGGRPLFPYVVTQVCRDPPFPYLKFIADLHTYGRLCRWWVFLFASIYNADDAGIVPTVLMRIFGNKREDWRVGDVLHFTPPLALRLRRGDYDD